LGLFLLGGGFILKLLSLDIEISLHLADLIIEFLNLGSVSLQSLVALCLEIAQGLGIIFDLLIFSHDEGLQVCNGLVILLLLLISVVDVLLRFKQRAVQLGHFVVCLLLLVSHLFDFLLVRFTFRGKLGLEIGGFGRKFVLLNHVTIQLLLKLFNLRDEFDLCRID